MVLGRSDPQRLADVGTRFESPAQFQIIKGGSQSGDDGGSPAPQGFRLWSVSGLGLQTALFEQDLPQDSLCAELFGLLAGEAQGVPSRLGPAQYAQAAPAQEKGFWDCGPPVGRRRERQHPI